MSGLAPDLIYVIDDDPVVRVFLEHVLAPAGYLVEGFESVASLLSTAQARPPALFMIDIRLPDTSGEEIVGGVRGLPGCETTPVLMMTGSGRLDRISAALQAGAQGFLLKPFTPDQALGAVRRWTGAGV